MLIQIGSPVKAGARYGEVINYHQRGFTIRGVDGKCFVARASEVKRTWRVKAQRIAAGAAGRGV